MHYIGLDVHSKNFTVAVMDRNGQVLLEGHRPTSEHNLRDVVAGVSGAKVVALEETTVAAWVYRVLKPHAYRVIVCDPRHNELIAKSGHMTDAQAARQLADLARGKFVKAVYHPADEGRQAFRELVQSYHQLQRELVRVKNQLKAKLRQQGIPCAGSDVYQPHQRTFWLAQIKHDDVRFQVEMMMETVEHLMEQKVAYLQRLKQRAKAFPEIAAFQALAGIGLVHAATFYALVDEPQRFANKKRLWSYCGLGIAQRSSDGMSSPPHLNRNGNRLLKCVAKSAAQMAVRHGDNAFARQYQRLIANGVKSTNGQLTVARAIIATMFAMWRKGEAYIPREV
jgi:transposase